jgi:hypothetical protein
LLGTTGAKKDDISDLKRYGQGMQKHEKGRANIRSTYEKKKEEKKLKATTPGGVRGLKAGFSDEDLDRIGCDFLLQKNPRKSNSVLPEPSKEFENKRLMKNDGLFQRESSLPDIGCDDLYEFKKGEVLKGTRDELAVWIGSAASYLPTTEVGELLGASAWRLLDTFDGVERLYCVEKS